MIGSFVCIRRDSKHSAFKQRALSYGVRTYVRQSPFQTWNNSLQPAAGVEGFCLVEHSLECRACKTEEGLGRCSDS